MALKINNLVFNPFEENTYIIYDDMTKETLVIDPGMMDKREIQQFDKFIKDNNLKIRHLINTHIHIDHVAGDNYVSCRYDVSISAAKKDAFLATHIVEQARMFHLKGNFSEIDITNGLTDGETLNIGRYKMEVIYVPGHSPGSIAIYCPSEKWIIVGDALFRRSIGRTDLPGGDYNQLVSSITKRLMPLPSETIVYPGHGISTTIGEEKNFNPYISELIPKV